ncbi:MAG: DUF4440 domain-containing protein [Puniceicoccaceae bacterium]|nr:MAG: DUF4440 domain-containing protein [Puniceicoccaceae bacterium]
MTPEHFISAYEQALASQDWDKVAPLVHEDCVATFSSGTYKGKGEVEGVFRHNFKAIKGEHYAIRNVYWVRQAGDFAVYTFDFRWSGIINGEKASGGGRGTSVIAKTGAEWQLLSEHLGPPAPAQS